VITNENTPLVCPIQQTLEDIHKRLSTDRPGTVASYIPELSKANPDWFGACLVTADGRIYEIADTSQEFTIQSISKPFVYGMALPIRGAASVWLLRDGHPSRRIATFAQGMTFGEMGLLDQQPRSADVTTDSLVEVMVLDRQSFNLLSNSHHLLHGRILRDLTLARNPPRGEHQSAVGVVQPDFPAARSRLCSMA
jgi:Glutaminase/Cyclic nucleotide-binding domain